MCACVDMRDRWRKIELKRATESQRENVCDSARQSGREILRQRQSVRERERERATQRAKERERQK